jgi:hypothetical protein
MNTRSLAQQVASPTDRQIEDIRSYGYRYAARIAFDAVKKVWLIRRREGMKQKQLAAALGRPPAWISRLFMAPSNWTLRTLGELAAAMDADLEINLSPKANRQFGTPDLLHSIVCEDIREERDGKNTIVGVYSDHVTEMRSPITLWLKLKCPRAGIFTFEVDIVDKTSRRISPIEAFSIKAPYDDYVADVYIQRIPFKAEGSQPISIRWKSPDGKWNILATLFSSATMLQVAELSNTISGARIGDSRRLGAQ